ncbi:unnamed protein product, partial [Ectocarpus sp. 6 AP-2014]
VLLAKVLVPSPCALRAALGGMLVNPIYRTTLYCGTTVVAYACSLPVQYPLDSSSESACVLVWSIGEC